MHNFRLFFLQILVYIYEKKKKEKEKEEEKPKQQEEKKLKHVFWWSQENSLPFPRKMCFWGISNA